MHLPGGCTEVSRSSSSGICQLLFKIHTAYNSFRCTYRLAAETGDGNIKWAGMGGGGGGGGGREGGREIETQRERETERQR